MRQFSSLCKQKMRQLKESSSSFNWSWHLLNNRSQHSIRKISHSSTHSNKNKKLFLTQCSSIPNNYFCKAWNFKTYSYLNKSNLKCAAPKKQVHSFWKYRSIYLHTDFNFLWVLFKEFKTMEITTITITVLGWIFLSWCWCIHQSLYHKVCLGE